jgi:hypothetical protein
VYLASIAAGAAYRVPTAVDFNVLHELARSRVKLAREHARDLRQDPGYYLEEVRQRSTHCKGVNPERKSNRLMHSNTQNDK